MPEKVDFKPKQYHTITPQLICKYATKAIEFYTRVFGATDVRVMKGPNDAVMHAELTIGDSLIFVGDSMMGKTQYADAGAAAPTYLHIYVQDVDDIVSRFVAEGSTVDAPVQDMFWGDRWGKLTDPFGQQWGIATHKEDVSGEEMNKRMKAMFGGQGASAGASD